jgi:hypothetical protein
MTASILLPANALSGVRVGVSVSDSADLARLGLMESHFRLALGEIARCVLVSGGELAYGGALRSDGYTAFLIQELHRYTRRDQPLSVYLSWQEHRKLAVTALREQITELGLYGRLYCLDPDGRDVAPDVGRSGDRPAEEKDANVIARSLSAMRKRMTTEIAGRVLLGGKRSGYRGVLPGVLEEAAMSLDGGQPLYLAGGFGGITLDIVGTLGIDDIRWMPRASGEVVDMLAQTELKRIASIKPADNGLSPDECRRLARTYRPSEIAALISLGLGRLHGAIKP